MQEKITIAVLLACHNRCDLTLTCLRSLQLQSIGSDIQVEVFLVDDGSTDGTSAALAEQFPDVHVIIGNGELFWNRGMHAAFSEALKDDFDFYVWLNDDCQLYPDTINILLKAYRCLVVETGSSAHIIGSAMQESNTGKFTYGGVKKYKTILGRVKQQRIEPDQSIPLRCDAVNGNCVLIAREVVSRIGNLDPIFTHRWGDHDYCFRAIKAGCDVWLAPGYRGSCKANPITGTWEDVKMPMVKRFNALRSQRGYSPHDYKVYLRRHRGRWWRLNYIAPYFKIIVSHFTGKLRPQ